MSENDSAGDVVLDATSIDMEELDERLKRLLVVSRTSRIYSGTEQEACIILPHDHIVLDTRVCSTEDIKTTVALAINYANSITYPKQAPWHILIQFPDAGIRESFEATLTEEFHPKTSPTDISKRVWHLENEGHKINKKDKLAELNHLLQKRGLSASWNGKGGQLSVISLKKDKIRYDRGGRKEEEFKIRKEFSSTEFLKSPE